MAAFEIGSEHKPKPLCLVSNRPDFMICARSQQETKVCDFLMDLKEADVTEMMEVKRRKICMLSSYNQLVQCTSKQNTTALKRKRRSSYCLRRALTPFPISSCESNLRRLPLPPSKLHTSHPSLARQRSYSTIFCSSLLDRYPDLLSIPSKVLCISVGSSHQIPTLSSLGVGKKHTKGRIQDAIEEWEVVGIRSLDEWWRVRDLDVDDLAIAQRGECEDLVASANGDAEDFGGGGKEVGVVVEEGATKEGEVGELACKPKVGGVELRGREREAAEVGFGGGSWGAAEAVGRASLSF
ncbi:hypothetical protein AAC387_Pa02g2487 [Persea americana]